MKKFFVFVVLFSFILSIVGCINAEMLFILDDKETTPNDIRTQVANKETTLKDAFFEAIAMRNENNSKEFTELIEEYRLSLLSEYSQYISIVSDQMDDFMEIQPVKKREINISPDMDLIISAPAIHVNSKTGETNFFMSISLNRKTWIFMNKVKFKWKELELELVADDSKISRMVLDDASVLEQMSFALDNEQIGIIKTLSSTREEVSYRIYSNAGNKNIDLVMTSWEKQMYLNMTEYYEILIAGN